MRFLNEHPIFSNNYGHYKASVHTKFAKSIILSNKNIIDAPVTTIYFFFNSTEVWILTIIMCYGQLQSH